MRTLPQETVRLTLAREDGSFTVPPDFQVTGTSDDVPRRSPVVGTQDRGLMGHHGDLAMARPEAHEATPLTLLEREVLDGLMLGDGCLSLGKKSRNPCLRITRTAVDLDYIHWTADVFRARLTDASVRVRTILDGRTHRAYESARFRTRCDSALRAPHLRWYPGGTKVVPDDLRLSAVSVAVWFADDGSVRAASRRTPEIKFATHGFQGSEVQRLADLLADRYEQRFPVYAAEKPGQFTIRASGSAAKALLRDIDPVFPPLARKADRWRDSELLTDRVAPSPCPRCASDRVHRWARSSKGVQQFKCLACTRVFRESYERVGRIPQPDPETVARSTATPSFTTASERDARAGVAS